MRLTPVLALSWLGTVVSAHLPPHPDRSGQQPRRLTTDVATARPMNREAFEAYVE